MLYQWQQQGSITLCSKWFQGGGSKRMWIYWYETINVVFISWKRLFWGGWSGCGWNSVKMVLSTVIGIICWNWYHLLKLVSSVCIAYYKFYDSLLWLTHDDMALNLGCDYSLIEVDPDLQPSCSVHAVTRHYPMRNHIWIIRYKALQEIMKGLYCYLS